MTELSAERRSRRRGARRGLVAAGLALPVVAAAFALPRVADALGAAAGAALASAARFVPVPARHEAAPGVEVETEPAAPAPIASGGKPAPPAPAPKGVLVRADVVARAAKHEAMPAATPVPAVGKRPAGLRLSGVGGYGLRDGDVLTQAAGAPATSVKAVAAAVAAALSAHAAAVSGVVWRGEQSFPLTVEIPWPKEGAAPGR